MLALRTCSNVERLADEMIFYGLIRFEFCSKNLSSIECQCERRFQNDENHQYVLSLSHRLLPKQRLDLISLMQNDLKHFSTQLVDSTIDFRSKLRTSSSNSSIGTRRTNSNSDEIDLPLKISCSIDGLRRKKSASLNSPANSVENRPTAEELERRELPWCWRSYSVCQMKNKNKRRFSSSFFFVFSFQLKRDRRGYGLILQGAGPCYVERLDPYGSAFSSGIRVKRKKKARKLAKHSVFSSWSNFRSTNIFTRSKELTFYVDLEKKSNVYYRCLINVRFIRFIIVMNFLLHRRCPSIWMIKMNFQRGKLIRHLWMIIQLIVNLFSVTSIIRRFIR